MQPLEIFAGAPAGFETCLLDPTIALAAAQAGAVGLLDCEFAPLPVIAAALRQVHSRSSQGTFAVKLAVADWAQVAALPELAALLLGERLGWVVLSLGGVTIEPGETPQALTDVVAAARALRLRVLVEVTSSVEAALGVAVAADGLIAKGHEAEGRVGEETAFVLLQRLVKECAAPIYVHGGVGLHTAAACLVGGARGVVITSPLLLTRESPLSDSMLARLGRLDGTEPQCHALPQITSGEPARYRLYTRPGSPAQASLQHLLRAPAAAGEAAAYQALSTLLQHPSEQRAWLLGQDIAYAAALGRRFGATAAILQAVRDAATEQLAEVAAAAPLAEGSPLSQAHSTRYPIVQGAMTRVSDTAEFAWHVASNGALPFLAVALLRNAELETLLSQTANRLGTLSWGVGILGFVPPELRQEQLEVVLRYKPPFALIAGGRPDQAQALEAQGIRTYLHVPSPLLLRSFVEQGARRFIFEGRECGGHVGPRSSFVLWEAMVAELLDAAESGQDLREVQLLLAGGISDARSAAMAVAITAPLLRLGVKVGVLMGTAYLFTEEAVQAGAVTAEFQREVLRCERTVLFETGPGHAIRCLDSPYRRTFDARRNELVAKQASNDETRQELEMMNLGRLRIASKGVARVDGALTTLPAEQQWQDGMFMVGQVAVLHAAPLTMGALHAEISAGGTALLQKLHPKEAIKPPTWSAPPPRPSEDIAIIGMSCLFPEANQLAAYWRNILNRVDTITEVPKSHWAWEKLYDPDPLARDKINSKWGGFLGDIPLDPRRYGIPPSSLAAVDPMQLMMLEVTRAALADAGYSRRGFARGRTSVILANAGHGPITVLYSLRSMLGWLLSDLSDEQKEALANSLPEWTEDSFAGYLGNVAAGRISNRFDLGGVNFSIDAACASSLAALYLGVRELRDHSSDLVLLSAIDTHNQPGDYLSFAKTHALSPRGRCRTFDASADGIVISEGAAVLVLKRRRDAERDGDRIYALVRGVGGSSDGRDRSLTAPRPEGQLLALERAYADAGISPATVGLVEAHGTGTVAGDRAEVAALRMMWQQAGASTQSCALGSVKTMIGHTKSAAGLASLIKVAKALHHKVLPPTMGVTTPSPACELERSPFYLCTEGRPWLQPAAAPRRAGVSAFGFGGTNFHTVLEEYPSSHSADAANQATPDWPSELFLLNAASPSELLGRIAQLRAEVGAELAIDVSLVGPVEAEVPRRSLFQVAHAHYLRQLDRPAATGLTLGIVASSLQELHDKLDAAATRIKEPGPLELKDPRGIYCFGEPLGRSRKVAFLFPGQGSQRVGMLADLALYFPEVRQALERADESLAGRLPQRLSRYFLPPPTFTDAERSADRAALTDTRVAQAALGAAELAALGLLRALGIDAELVAGHSYGEYVALHAAGVFSESGLLDVSAVRGRLLAESPAGTVTTMAAVGAAAATVAPLLAALPGVTLANHNSPAQCVIGGTTAAVDDAVTALTGRGLIAKKIAVSAAFHSPHMAYAQKPLAEAVAAAVVGAPQRQVFCNLDAAAYPAQSAGIAERLAEHLVKPVLFEQTVRALYAAGAGLFVEVGPGSVLSGLVDATLPQAPHLALPLERAGKDGLTSFLQLLAQLAASGVAVDQSLLYRHRRQSHANPLGLPAPSADAVAAKPQLLYAMNSARIERVVTKDGRPVRVAPPPPARPAAPAAPAKSAAPIAVAKDQEAGGIRPIMYTTSPTSLAPARAAPAAEEHIAPGPSTGGRSPAAAWPEPPASAPAWAPAPSGAEQVMLQFQQTMVQLASGFLETQQRVMLAYLESQPGSAAALGTLPLPSPALLAPPARPIAVPAPMAAAAVGGQFLAPASAAPQSTYVPPAVPTLPVASLPPAPPQQQVAQAAPAPAIVQVQPLAESQDLGAQLLQIVSERTGYPLEMLDPDLDLEADLGIDSIKRIEILNTFRKLLPKEQQQRLEKDVEKLAGSKTLKSIMGFVQQGQPGVGGLPLSPKQAPAATPVDRRTAGADKQVGVTQELLRAVRCEVALPALAAPSRGAATFSRPLLVIGDHFADSAAVGDRLLAAGVPIVRAGLAAEGTPTYAVDLDDEADVQRLLQKLEQEHGGIGGLLYLVGLGPQLTDQALGGRFPVPLGRLMRLAKHLRPQLENGVVLCCSQPDRGDTELPDPGALATTAAEIQAALGGAIRSLGREWPRARVRSVALTNELPEEQTAALLCAELLDPEARTEIIYRGTERHGVQAQPAPLPSLDSAASPALGPQCVIVLTGGARGVTAAAAAELARRYQPTLVLVGRSPLPSGPEAADTAELHSLRELKAALVQRLRSAGKPVAIPAIEAAYEALLREREVRATLAKLTALGARVHYHAVDVSDPVATTALVQKLYETHGRIDGLLHGAGVIHDAPIHTKSLASARRVYETKVLSARTLLQALRIKELRFCAFFSSIVAHTGNAAQVDYAAANAALNQLALELDAQTPARVVSLLWGPWRGGMVRPELEEILRGAGWELIEEAAGAAACVDELQQGNKGAVEVLLTAPTGEAARSAGGSAPLAVRLGKLLPRHTGAGVTEIPLRLEVGVDHYLLDHSIDGVPVLPLAGALSLIAEAAALCAPGWHVGRIEQLTLLSGVRLVDGSCELTLRCTEKLHTEQRRQLHVEVLNGQGKPRPHYRATVELFPSLAAVADSATGLALPPRVTLGASPLPVPELYGRWLFHGPLFQGITAIDGFSELGVAGHLRASHPADCLVGVGPAEQWLVDPILLDSAMQLAGVWSRHFGGVTVLPMGCQTLVRFGAPKSASCLGRVRIVPSEDQSELRCDVAVFDLDGTPVLLMLGLFGVGSKALNRIATGTTPRSLAS